MTPLVYLKQELSPSFFDEWKKLDQGDKNTLKRWAETEMKARGILSP